MPSRDGLGCRLLLRINSVTRREALRSVGDALPTTRSPKTCCSASRCSATATSPLSLRAAGFRARAGRPQGLLRAAQALGARGDADPLSRGRTARPQPQFDAAIAVSPDALAVARPHAASHAGRAAGFPVDRHLAAGQCHAGSRAVDLLPMILAVAGGIWPLRRGIIFPLQPRCTALSRVSRSCRRSS